MKWTTDDIEFLVNNYNKGTKFCSICLKITEYSVRWKLRKMKIKLVTLPHTDERKKKISDGMKRAHIDGRAKGWSFINKDQFRRSYPETFFINVIENNDLFKNFDIKEKFPYGKYFIDFLVVDLKLVIEIDGSQHYKTDESINHDKIRDNFFINEGFKVYRIKWIDLFNNPKNEIDELISFIIDIENKTIRRYDITDIKKIADVKKCKCGEIIKTTNGRLCKNCCNKNKRKITDRPEINILKKEVEENGYSATGRKYGVSDNCIRKWIFSSHIGVVFETIVP